MRAKRTKNREFCAKRYLSLVFLVCKWYINNMFVKLARKRIYKKCVIMLICLLMFGSLACGAVLCFGSDGHVSVEFKLADCCGEPRGFPVQAFLDPCANIEYSEGMCSVSDCIDVPLSGNCVTKRFTSFVTKKSSPLNILPKTIFSASINDTVSTNKERVAKSVNYVSDTLTSICTTVLII